MNGRNLVVGLALLGLASQVARAGSMNTILTVAARYDNAVSFNPLPLTLTPSGAVANGQPGIYQVDISFTATSAPGEKGWNNSDFDLGVGPKAGGSNLALDLALPYSPNTGTLDINGPGPGGVLPIYAVNEDADIPGDLKAIEAGIGSFNIVDTANDTRNKLGTPQAPAEAGYPSYFGSFFVNWNGQGTGSVALKNLSFFFSLTSGLLPSRQFGPGTSVGFGVPEPSTFALLALAFVGIVSFVYRGARRVSCASQATLKLVAFSAIAFGLIAATAQAGSMNTILTVAGRYDNAVSFNPLPLAFTPSGAVANGQPGLYVVDISFTATNGPGDKGWANTLFDLGVGPNKGGSNLALNLSLPYTPNVGTLDINGATPGGVVPIYGGANTDAGIPGDLKNILASIVAFNIVDTPNDTRNKLGTPQAPAAAGYPSYIGSFFVNWNGQGSGNVVLNNLTYTFSLTSNTFGQVQDGAGATALFGVPEPATMTLAAFGLAGLAGFAGRRKRSRTNHDVLTRKAMYMKLRVLAFSLALSGLISATATAGSMNTFLTVAARFDNDTNFNELPLTIINGHVANGQPGLYQVDVSFTAINDAGDKGWANTLFDASVGPNVGGSNLALDLSPNTGGYLPNPNTLDTNGPGQPGGVKPIYATNTDGGAAGDLKAIVASIESAKITTTANDTRNNLGTPQAPAGALNPPDPGTWIGSFWINWNGLGQGSATVSNQQFSFTTTANTFGATQLGAGATALFGVPEPATLTLAGFGLIGLIGLARRSKQSRTNHELLM